MMRWASFDPFTIDDPFWQDKMGMPVANKEFLRSLLGHGTFDSYHFFCADSHQVSQFEKTLNEMAPEIPRDKVKVSPQALSLDCLKSEPVDIMHNGDFTHFMPYLIELRNRLAGKPPFAVTGVTHSLDTVSLHTQFLQLLLARPKPFDAIICTSQCAVDMLRKSFDHMRALFDDAYNAKLPAPPALVKVPLGVPNEIFEVHDKAYCRQQLGIPPHHFVMLSLARFSPRRKMDLSPLLECLNWLEEERRSGSPFPEFTVVLAGAGKSADLKLVQNMVDLLGLHHRVRVDGNVSPDRKRLLYGATDVFLSLVDNYQETFGLTIVEAMAQGLPVVASEFNGYRELVEHGRTGFLIPTYASTTHEPWELLSGLMDSSVLRFYRAQKVSIDMDKLALAIRALAAHPEARKAMGTIARSRAMDYRWPIIVRQYEQLWVALREETMQWQRSEGVNEAGAPAPMLVPSTEVSFGHYTSDMVDPKTVLSLSQYGAYRSTRPFQPVIYEETAIVLNNDCLEFLTRHVRQGSCTVASLLDQAQTSYGFSREMLMLQVDWLLKHGFFRVVD